MTHTAGTGHCNWPVGSTLVFCVAAMLTGCAGESGGTGPSGGTGSDYTGFATAVRVTMDGYAGDAMEPFISKDGQYLFFNNRNDPATETDLYYAVRIDDRTFAFQGPLQGANSPQLDGVASLDATGRLYFVSGRSYETTLSSLYDGQFLAGEVADVAVTEGVSRQQPGWVNFDAEISADGRTLWFDDGRYSANGILLEASIVVADREGDTFVRRADSAQLLHKVNVSGLNYAPCISVDGLELFFTRVDSVTSGAAPAIYRASRPDTQSAFGEPQRVAAATGFVEAPTLSADGLALYFHKAENGAFVLYRTQR